MSGFVDIELVDDAVPETAPTHPPPLDNRRKNCAWAGRILYFILGTSAGAVFRSFSAETDVTPKSVGEEENLYTAIMGLPPLPACPDDGDWEPTCTKGVSTVVCTCSTTGNHYSTRTSMDWMQVSRGGEEQVSRSNFLLDPTEASTDPGATPVPTLFPTAPTYFEMEIPYRVESLHGLSNLSLHADDCLLYTSPSPRD